MPEPDLLGWDDHDEAEPTCPSCGIAYVNHLGLIGTCQREQALHAILHGKASTNSWTRPEDEAAFYRHLYHHAKADIERIRAKDKGLRSERFHLIMALRDALRLPQGVIPHSAQKWGILLEKEPIAKWKTP